MRWIKIIIIFLIIVFGVYAISMLFVEKYQTFSFTKNVSYPVEKVYPQFSNLQNLTDWYNFEPKMSNISFSYFSPYEGEGSSLTFYNRKDTLDRGELFLRDARPNKEIRFQYFRNDDSSPALIKLNLTPAGENTEVTWVVRTPGRSFLKKSLNLLYEENFRSAAEQSLLTLESKLSDKVYKETQINAIKYDTIILEKRQGGVLLGISDRVRNRKKGEFQNSVIMDYNRLNNFIKKDLGKKSDEFGEVQLIIQPENLYTKEVPYFLGSFVAKKFEITDNNFSFSTVSPADVLVSYYKGDYEGRKIIISRLLKEAKRRELKIGDITEMFLEAPSFEKDVRLKISLQVY